MICVFIGMPGSGKGTRAALVSKELNIPTISAGETLRQCKSLTDEQRAIMSRGEILPPDEVSSIMFERLKADDCKNGYILDGFPRGIKQAEDLDKFLAAQGKKIDKVFVLEVSEEVVINRLMNRISCKVCGAVYNNVGRQPKIAGICDVCGAKLTKRDDDLSEEIIKNRFSEYYKKTAPLLDYYSNRNIIVKVDSNKEADEIYKYI